MNLQYLATGVQEDIVHLLAGQKRLKDDYKDPDVLPKINKSVMAETIDAIKDYLRLHHSVMKALLYTFVGRL